MSDTLPAWLKDDSVPARFAAAVREAYGDRLERIVSYGSRARGDQKRMPLRLSRAVFALR